MKQNSIKQCRFQSMYAYMHKTTQQILMRFFLNRFSDLRVFTHLLRRNAYIMKTN